MHMYIKMSENVFIFLTTDNIFPFRKDHLLLFSLYRRCYVVGHVGGVLLCHPIGRRGRSGYRCSRRGFVPTVSYILPSYL